MQALKARNELQIMYFIYMLIYGQMGFGYFTMGPPRDLSSLYRINIVRYELPRTKPPRFSIRALRGKT